MEVRKAIYQDVDDCISMGRLFWSATQYSRFFDYDETSISKLVLALIDMNMMVVAHDGDKLIGVAGGIVAPWPFNFQLLAGAELFWYVIEDYRKSGIGTDILKALERCAKDAGADIWSMIRLENLDPDSVEKLYLKNGYLPAEKTYVKVL